MAKRAQRQLIEHIDPERYAATLKERKKESRVYSAHQMVGLDLATILNDSAHKSLYMRLAKQYNPQELLTLAKSIATRKGVRNKGAYFMRLLHEKKQ